LAGEVGIEPWSFTLAELFEMATGHSFAQWHHTAAIQATLANTVRDAKRRRSPFYARDFHPHVLHAARVRRKRAGHRESSRDEMGVGILKSVFVDNAPIGKVMEFHGIDGG